jgi:methionyl-tRNA formyltransferase
MRVAFLGNDPWSVPSLQALVGAEDIEVALVVTNPPRPAGRGSKLRPTSVADAARELERPLLEVGRVRDGDGFDALAAAEPDALIVVAYGEILTPDVLDIPRRGAVNVHFSLLPRWRGAAPVQHAILAGDETTGVTVMMMDEGMDTGPILATQGTPIDSEEDAGALGDRLSEMGASLLVDALRGFELGTIEPRAQPDDGATLASKPRPHERVIDWADDAKAIVRRVRAFAPDPGATTTFRREPLKVVKADAPPIGGYMTAAIPMQGEIRIESDGTPVVHGLGDGAVRLLEVAPAGRKRMSGADWARGARIRPGELLG